MSLPAFLAACNSRGPEGAKRLLKYAERKNEAVERMLFRHTSMDAPIAGTKLAGNALPSYYISKTVPVWNESERGRWSLEIGGLVQRPMKLTLENLTDSEYRFTQANQDQRVFKLGRTAGLSFSYNVF